MELEDMLADIAKNNADEQDAIEGYLNCYEPSMIRWLVK